MCPWNMYCIDILLLRPTHDLSSGYNLGGQITTAQMMFILIRVAYKTKLGNYKPPITTSTRISSHLSGILNGIGTKLIKILGTWYTCQSKGRLGRNANLEGTPEDTANPIGCCHEASIDSTQWGRRACERNLPVLGTFYQGLERKMNTCIFIP